MIITKKPVSPLDSMEFQDKPYDTNGRFCIYLPKEKNYLLDLLKSYTSPKDQTQSSGDGTQPDSKAKSKLRKELEEARSNAAELSAQQNNRNGLEILDKGNEPVPQSILKSPQSILKNSGSYGQRSIPDSTLYQSQQLRPQTSSQVYRDSISQTSQRKSLRSSASKRSHLSKHSSSTSLRETLYFDPRTQSVPKSSIKSKVIEDLVRSEQDIAGNPVLMESLVKLRDLNLLKDKDPHFKTYKGAGKVDFIFSHYHSRETNPGYSRNKFGTPFYH